MAFLQQMPWGKIKPPVGWRPDGGAVSDLGIVGVWLFNEGGGDLVNDSVGVNQGTGATFAPSPLGNGLKFATTNVTCLNASAVTSNQLTVLCWIVPDVTTRGDLVSCWTGGSANSQFDLLYGVTTGKPALYVSDGGLHGGAVGTDAMVAGNPYMVAGTYDGSVSSSWLNGTLQGQSTDNITLATAALTAIRFGNNGSADGQFTGAMWFALYADRAWTPTEIYRAYNDPFFWMQQPTRALITGLPAPDTSVVVHPFAPNLWIR